ncbi:MAG: hypothetical protein MUP22_03450, partial [Desulfobacterales bacterium]|nr:hypothetical protein [Desulfobacterales bacterium]
WPLFSRPPKSLTAENGLSYGLRVGLLFVIIVGSFIAFDYILLPRFGKEIGAGLGIGFSADIQIGNYRSILGSFLKEILSPKHIKLLNSFYSLVTLLVLPILAGGIIYEFLGKWADKRRTKDFPQEAFSFLFGKEALAQLLAENKSIEEEKNKTALYERLTGLGMKTSKDNFEQIYKEMKGHISGGCTIVAVLFSNVVSELTIFAIQTDDVGRLIGDGFEIDGRASSGESKGCALTIDELTRLGEDG